MRSRQVDDQSYSRQSCRRGQEATTHAANFDNHHHQRWLRRAIVPASRGRRLGFPEPEIERQARMADDRQPPLVRDPSARVPLFERCLGHAERPRRVIDNGPVRCFHAKH